MMFTSWRTAAARMIPRAALGLIAIAAPASTASAQTLFATRGLGAPIAATDARAAALGGIGVGLTGFNFSFENPADAAGLLRRGATATLAPTWNDVEVDGQSDGIGGSRFPLIRVFYPVSARFVASLGYGAYLDQTWGVRFEGEEVLGSDTVATSDVLRSTGGISQLRLAFSYELTPTLAVGVAGGMLTGNLDRSVVRTFGDSTVFEPFESRLRWSYHAPQAAFGARWDPIAGTRVSGSVSLAGKLHADAQDSAALDRTYGSSMRYTVGASTRIAPMLMATAAASRQTYPEIRSVVVPVTNAGAAGHGASTQDVWQYGGGLEYTGLRSGATVYPFRLGYRHAQLPYAGTNEEPPTEWGIAAGAGFEISTDIGLPQALFNISLERTFRDGLAGEGLPDGLHEKFWRMNMTVSLFGR
jgi:hypothetical protein